MSKKKQSRSRRQNQKVNNTQGVPNKKKTAPKKSRQPLGTRTQPPMTGRKVRGPPKGRKGNSHKYPHIELPSVHKKSPEKNAPFLNHKDNKSAIILPDSESPRGELSLFDSPAHHVSSTGYLSPVVVYQTTRIHIETHPTIVIVDKSEPVNKSPAKSGTERMDQRTATIQLTAEIIGLVTAILVLLYFMVSKAPAPNYDPALASPTGTAVPSITLSATVTLSPSRAATFSPPPTNTLTNTPSDTPPEIPPSIPTIPPTSPPPAFGQLKVCNVAGAGVTLGQLFTINVNNWSYNVPAGTLTDSSCIFVGEFPVNTQVTVQEVVSPGYLVEQIGVKPERRAVIKDVSLGMIVVKIRRGQINVTFTNKASDLPTSTPTNSPTFTPTVTGTFYLSTTPTVGASSTPTPPNTSIPTDMPLPTVVYTPTQPPTITPTSDPVDHELIVDIDRSCRGWEVNVTVNPTNGEVRYIPAQSGEWNKDKEVTVIITAIWPDGIVKTDEIKISKPDCDE